MSRNSTYHYRAIRLVLALFSFFFVGTSYAATLSGVIKDKSDNPISGANALLYQVSNGTLVQTGDIIQVSDSGAYSWVVDDGDYVIRAYFSATDVPLVGAPNSAFIQSEDFPVVGDTVRDSRFNFFLLTGTIVDSNQLPIAGVDIQTAKAWSGPEQGSRGFLSQYSINHSNKANVTDASGQYNVLLFSTDVCIASDFFNNDTDCYYDITFSASVGSGFANETEAEYIFRIDQVLNEQLNIDDQTPAKNIVNPYVRYITDTSATIEWMTDEVTTGNVNVTAIGSFASTELRKFHSVSISGLSANTSYSAQVNSNDQQGNSTTQVNVNFSSLSSPDTDAPTFIKSPYITEINDNLFAVEFCASEPVTGKLIVEDVDYPLSGLSSCHSLTIDELDSNRTYRVVASISDNAANGPVLSPVLEATTLPASDWKTPVIITGPTIVDISDSTAVVLWVTDEPATSDLSFNDGINFRVSKDPNLVIQHRVQLTGLSASNIYQLAISSTDVAGNGPALSNSIGFTTETQPDLASPTILGRPLVEDITDNTAVVRWNTDEFSSSKVLLGTAANNLNRIEASADFSSKHQIEISGLLASTTYFYSVQSVDLSGNQNTSEVFSFTTFGAYAGDDLQIISGPIIERLTGNSITLSWLTNQNSDSRLVCESSNGKSQVNRFELEKNHLITLTGLEFSTRYRCVIYSSDINGYIATEVIAAVSTEEVDNTPPDCSTPATVDGYVSFAELTWQSNEFSFATVNYRKVGDTSWKSQISSEVGLQGFLRLTGLEANTDYQQQLTLIDVVGNSAVCAIGEFNSGTNPDVPTPVFSVQPQLSEISKDSVTIDWNTEKSSNGIVKYGLTAQSLTGQQSDANFALSHKVVVNSLQPNTTYFVQVDAFSVDGDTASSDVLSFTTQALPETDINPAKIITGPTVIHITDVTAVVEWQTDKAANSQVAISGGNTFVNEEFVTSHSVLLTNLTAATDYATLVSSTDVQGNASDSKPADFRTLDLPDSSLPKFVTGPSVISIDYDRFTVTFCADEAVTAVVSIDENNFNLDSAKICHEFTVTELTANTTYTVVVSITDVAGNGPVISDPILATTLFDLDIEAPTLTGPTVIDITDSTAIVIWTTNESATSGVSYTDGSTSNDFYDNGLTSEHIVYLSNLTPDTSYTLTASSTDAFGNGPSISQPVEFRTLALPDTQQPTIISGPFVEDITTNSAYVVWTTNESSSSLVLLGTLENALNQSFTVADLATDHQVPLTNLTADTLYYLQAVSSDLAGNSVSSPVLSFRTLTEQAQPVTLQIIDGPNVENATNDSLTIGWETNLNADSRLVCYAEQSANNLLSFPLLAKVNPVPVNKAIENQYIVLLKEVDPSDSSVGFSKLSASQKKTKLNNAASDIASKVNATVLQKYSNKVNGFVLKMNQSELQTLRQDPRILMIEQDQVMSISATQNNPTWGLDRIDQADLPLNNSFTYEPDGTGVNTYVIDTGILTSHADFAGRAVSGWDFVDNDNDASDCHGHGTHVAGTVAATTWGVAKNASVTAIRVLGCNGSGSNSGVIAGVDWVAANAVQPAVANMSLGGGNSAVLDAAVNNAIDAGVTFVVAAGNSNINACSGSPNRVPAAITVASSTSSDSRSSFSNWGSCVDIFAPGSDITSTWSNGGINTISGTSMASPHVAGAVALFLQAYPNSTPAEVANGIISFAAINKIANPNGSPNLLLNVEFDTDTQLPPTPEPPPPERITFEVSSDEMVKSHLLTLAGLAPSTIYQCTVHSADIERNKVSANLRGTTTDVPDIIPPACTDNTNVDVFTDSALISWQSDELVTALVNYRQSGSIDWLTEGTLSLARTDALMINGLSAETLYEQQVTLTDASGNSRACPAGNFTTIAPQAIPEAVFKLQPVISHIGDHSATVSWETEQASSANVRYGKVRTSLDFNQPDDLLMTSHQIDLQNLTGNTVYYVQVDAYNILGQVQSSEIVNFTTTHPEKDFDQDGVPNPLDNCPFTANPEQLDSDGNGVGDACDEPVIPVDNDFDDDGILDNIDNCPSISNPEQLDQDNNGIGDACDAPVGSDNDFDDDTILDEFDNCPSIPNFDQLDSNNNGIGDACDAPIIITPPTTPPEQPVGINLRGVISFEGSPTADVIVGLYDEQQQLMSSVITDIDGAYLFQYLTAGNYYLGVTPPAATEFRALPLQAITIDDHDVVHLVSLISDGLKLSGIVTDSEGRVIDNIDMSLHLQTNGNQVGNPIKTNSLGYFEFLVAPGVYKIKPSIEVFNPNNEGLPLPAYAVPDFATILHAPQNIVVDDHIVLDVELPFAMLSGQTLDHLGNPVAGVGLSVQHQFSTLERDYYLQNYATDSLSNAISDSNGEFQFAVFTEQQFDIVLNPPANRLDLAVSIISDYSLTADSTESFSLVEGESLSGTLQDTLGRAIDNTKVTLHDQQTDVQVGAPVFTDAAGLFQFQVAPGSYKIKPHLNPFGIGEGRRPAYPLPDYASVLFAQEFSVVSGATVQNVVLPLAILSGKTTNSNGDPIADTRVTISHIAQGSNGPSVVSYFLESQGRSLVTQAKTDVNGDFAIALFTDQIMNITFVPPTSERELGATLFADYSISDDVSDTFVMTQALTLSGYLKDAQGIVIDNTMITVHHSTDKQLADAATLTDENGYFEFKVSAGEYDIRPYLQPNNTTGNQQVTPLYPVPDFAAVYYLAKSVSVTSDTQIDLSMPMSILSGQTLDANGVAIAGVKLKIDHSYAEDSISFYLENTGETSESNSISDENGSFGFGLFTNQSTDLSVEPLSGSGFAITNLNHNIDQATSENIYLVHKDTPPKIIYGPEIVRIGYRSAIVVWRTDKPAKGIIQLSNGRTINVDKLTTYNCILLWDLEPSTFYDVTVQAIDKDDQTSDTKATSFTTKGSVYIKPPEFISGPTISNITENQFELSFCSNGPVTGVVTVDSVSFVLDQLDLCHTITIDNRNPNTTYQLEVSITDPFGNGPTISEPQEVTTLPLPDTTPPIILLVPFVIDISDTEATVIWTTDEEANSGVSYNDGTQYHVVTEQEFVFDHNLQLTDLTPNTEYSLTVSSTDKQGNGPTLSQSILFTTLPSPDTTPPIIIGSPLIQNITHQSVVIRWNTDEPATTALVFGKDQNNLDDVEGNGGSLKTFHNLAITGLDADTIYYFRVQSQDATGNLITSEIMSFRTKVRGHQGVPHFTKAVIVEQITANSVTVSWSTDVNADGRLVCKNGTSASFEKSHSKRVKKHRLTLTGLSNNTSYQCTVYSADHKGYQASYVIEDAVETNLVSGDESESKTASGSFKAFLSWLSDSSTSASKADISGLDTQRQNQKIPAVTEAIQISGFGNLATVSLATDELTAVLVQYRPVGEVVWRQAGDLRPEKQHFIVVSELSLNAEYELQYTATNLFGESLQSDLSSFNTGTMASLSAPLFVAEPIVNDISESTATLSWDTGEFAYAQVSYGTNQVELLDKEANAKIAQSHAVTLVRLEPATYYFAKVTLFNIAGESLDSSIINFVTSAVNATDDSDGDGMTDVWEIENSLDPQDASDGGLDIDGDGLTNRQEFVADTNPNLSDTDSDGMPDGWEVDHQLDPNDAADADQDADGDGETNLEEYQNSVDSVAPVIQLVDQVTIDSSGVLTAIPTDNISANDNVDGNLPVSLVGATHLKSGFHMVDWLAVDGAGNRTVSTQQLNINPQVLMAQGQSSAEGSVIQVSVELSGEAPEYPVQLPFTISGTVTGDDYQLVGSDSDDYEVVGNTLHIYQGQVGVVKLQILDDGEPESDETLAFNLGQPTHAVIMENASHSVLITENNLAPSATLRAEQNDLPVTTVSKDGGVVTLFIDASDANSNDSLQIEWAIADIAQLSIDPITNALQLDPLLLQTGLYSKSVTVIDNGSPAMSFTQIINLNVIEVAPILLASVDSDNDGISDADEGFQDSDGDGIADYLDDLESPNLLQQITADLNSPSGSFVMQAEAGVRLTLGSTALTSGDSGALLSSLALESSLEFQQHGADVNYTNVGGVYDFEASNLSQAGDSINIVIPQQVEIPNDAVYRKLHPINGWFSFVIDGNNQLYSSPGSEGACPSPADGSYTEGLNAGDWCVMMLIEDGGQNDIDDSVNGRIVDPGGVTAPLAISTVSISPVVNVEEGSNISLTATIVDNGNTITSYLWEQVTGVSVGLVNQDQRNASVNAIPAGVYTFRLTITDELDRNSSDTVSVTVSEKVTVAPPTESSGGGGGGSISWLLLLMTGLLVTMRNHQQICLNVNIKE